MNAAGISETDRQHYGGFFKTQSMKPKTRRELLNSLPEPYKSQAFRNVRKQGNSKLLDLECSHIMIALTGGFFFSLSPEGEEYWQGVLLTIFNNQ